VYPLPEPFEWVDRDDYVQVDWLFKYFADILLGVNTYASLLLAYGKIPITERSEKIAKAKKAWAVKKHRLPKGKPVQIYLSTEARDYLNKATKSLSLKNSEVIEKVLLDQASLHHKETALCRKLRIQNKALKDKIQRHHAIRMEILREQSSLEEKILRLNFEIKDYQAKLSQIHANTELDNTTET
jgi:hypothetical protein